MKAIFMILSFLLVYQCVCQVCNETRSMFREVPETYRFSYIETYEEPCIIGLFCSIKTRKSVNVTTRMVQRYENVTANVCCEGYVENDNHEGNGLYCEPVCNPSCQNGYCKKPNQCACEAGYALDPLHPHVCKPLCLEGCEIFDCISTKTPQCFSNRTISTSNSNNPACTEPCINATCVGPEICKCLPGYYQTSTHSCRAISYFATEPCEHGTLIDPYTCLCDRGWEWKCGSCQPICNACDHGTCQSPGQCKCDHGYAMVRGRCEPECSNGCLNGRCISPEFCTCDAGWYKTEEGECKAHCNMNCDYGDCIAPNICDCHIGYQLYINEGISRCVPNRKSCKGSTSDPETCECEAPYETRYFADNGGDCDCIGVCLNSSSRCTQAICLYMDLTLDMIPPELNYDHDVHEKFDIRPDLRETLDIKDDKMTTVLPIMVEELDEAITRPNLNYDYDSDEEEGDPISDAKITSIIQNDEITTLSTFEKTETTTKNKTAKTFPASNYDSSKETGPITDIKNDEVSTSLGIERDNNPVTVNAMKSESESNYDFGTFRESRETLDLEKTPSIKKIGISTLSAVAKDITENTNAAKTAANFNDTVKTKDALKLPVYWIVGAAIVGCIFLCLILGMIMKRKCSKKHSLDSPSENNNVIVRYTNKTA